MTAAPSFNSSSNNSNSEDERAPNKSGQQISASKSTPPSTCSSSSSSFYPSPPRPSRIPFLRPISPISPSESSDSDGDGIDDNELINVNNSSDHCYHRRRGDDEYDLEGSGICSFYNENDDDDDEQEHFHSIQHPSHIPTPSTIDEDDGDEGYLDDVNASPTTTKNWLTDEVLPNVGGAIVGGVSKLTLFLGGEAGAEKLVEKKKEEEQVEETSENDGERTDKNNRCHHVDSNHETFKTCQRYSLGRQYWSSKRNELLLENTVVSVLQSKTGSVDNYSRDDTNSVGYDARNSEDQQKEEEEHRDDSCLVSSPLSPPRTNSSLIASPMSSPSSSSQISFSKKNAAAASVPTAVAANMGLGETSLHRKWVLENAFNLHSTRASQRILDDDDVLLSLSMLTDNEGDDDGDHNGNHNDESENHSDGHESDLDSNDDNSYHSSGSCILKDVPRSTFWDVYDTMEDLSRSRSNPRKHKHKGRFTGLTATQ